eukprot:jgi/Chlat1/6820/Chrsp51S06511
MIGGGGGMRVATHVNVGDDVVVHHSDNGDFDIEVRVVAPSGAVSAQLLQEGCATLASWPGLKVRVDPQCSAECAHCPYLAGDDAERASALGKALLTPPEDSADYINVLCAKGGYGAARVLEALDSIVKQTQQHDTQQHLFSRVRFLGFSDATALHCWMHRTDPSCTTFHSPMPATRLFINGTVESKASLRTALLSSDVHCSPLLGECLQAGQGVACGRVVGGNLTLLASMCGTPWAPDYDGAILLLEDVNEPWYKVDRMVTQLVQSCGGKLWENLAGLVLGAFTQANDGGNDSDADQQFEAAEFWLRHMKVPPHLPVLHKLPVGHILDNRVVRLNALAVIDPTEATLWFA